MNLYHATLKHPFFYYYYFYLSFRCRLRKMCACLVLAFGMRRIHHSYSVVDDSVYTALQTVPCRVHIYKNNERRKLSYSRLLIHYVGVCFSC